MDKLINTNQQLVTAEDALLKGRIEQERQRLKAELTSKLSQLGDNPQAREITKDIQAAFKNS